ncbi:MAG: hypothetical protein J6Y36_00655 [Treponema sp.]|nr:hypothetical protein [Treponema sp.]
MKYRINRKTRVYSILTASLTFLATAALCAVCIIPEFNKKSSPEIFVIAFCGFMFLSAVSYLIYTLIKQLKSFIILDKENGITYCNGFKTVQFKLKLVEQLNRETYAFTFLTLKNEKLRHEIVNFSLFEDKSEIHTFLIDNVTDRFGRLKFKTEQMIQQELDAENFSDEFTAPTQSDKKADERTIKNTNRILKKDFKVFNIQPFLFITFDILTNIIIFYAFLHKNIPLCIVYFVLLFIYPVYSHFSKIYSLEDLFYHFTSLFYLPAILTATTVAHLIDLKSFCIISGALTLIFVLLLFLQDIKKGSKTDAEKIIDSVQEDSSTSVFRKIFMAILLGTCPLILINDIFDRNADIVQQVTPFLQEGIYYAEVPVEKDGVSEKTVFKLPLNSKSKLDINKPVFYRYKKGYFKISSVYFFNKTKD